MRLNWKPCGEGWYSDDMDWPFHAIVSCLSLRAYRWEVHDNRAKTVTRGRTCATPGAAKRAAKRYYGKQIA